MAEHRPVWAEIDLGALRRNVAVLRDRTAPAQLLVVVKAEGYGHGAVPAATAAVEAGADWLGVALVEEGVELREAGIEVPIMVLSEPPRTAAAEVVAHRLTPVVYTSEAVDALADAVKASGAAALPVHLKVDTGMHRVGCLPDDALGVAKAIRARSELDLEGLLTHLALADEPDHPYTTEQLRRFDDVVAAVTDDGGPVRLVHVANSAAALADTANHRDLVRIGIAAYGVAPAPAFRSDELTPVLSLRARVSFVKDVPAGTPVSYGLHYTTPTASRLATVPLGYGDGVPRNLGLVGGEVLIRGRRVAVAGAVTMDQLVIDCGPPERDGDGRGVEPGDDVVLLGRQGDEEITAMEWAQRLGTIPYEIVGGLAARVPRRYLG